MRAILIIIFLFPFLPSLAQDTNRHSFGIQVDYGSLILHSRDIRPIGPSNPYGLGGEYSYWLLKKKHWRNCHCYPRIGLSLNYHNLDKPDILGWGMPLYGFLEPSYQLSKNLFFTLRGSLGYAWLSRPFDPETNPGNLSYSLHFTPFIQIGSGILFKLNPHFQLTFQMRYNHASNGGQREPNKGLNYPSLNIGFNYAPAGINFTTLTKKLLTELKKRNYISMSAFVAGKAIDATRVTYAVPGFSIDYTKQLGRVSALSAGVEWISNLGYRELIRQRNTGEDHNQLGLLVGHKFLLGNFTFTQMVGIYLYRDFDIKPDWYQRYGILWYPVGNFHLGTYLKAHGHVAEFLDFRIGYRISL